MKLSLGVIVSLKDDARCTFQQVGFYGEERTRNSMITLLNQNMLQQCYGRIILTLLKPNSTFYILTRAHAPIAIFLSAPSVRKRVVPVQNLIT